MRVERQRLERRQLGLWLVVAWIAIPALTLLTVRSLGDYSTGALWRWGHLVFWALVAPTIGAFRLQRRVRDLRREAPAIPESAVTALLAPGWQLVSFGVLAMVAVMILFVYYDR